MHAGGQGSGRTFSSGRSTCGHIFIYLSLTLLPPSWPTAGGHHFCYFQSTWLTGHTSTPTFPWGSADPSKATPWLPHQTGGMSCTNALPKRLLYQTTWWDIWASISSAFKGAPPWGWAPPTAHLQQSQPSQAWCQLPQPACPQQLWPNHSRRMNTAQTGRTSVTSGSAGNCATELRRNLPHKVTLQRLGYGADLIHRSKHTELGKVRRKRDTF